MNTAARQLQNVAAFLSQYDSEAEQRLALAETSFGHPMNWPRPPRRLPRWYEFKAKRHLREVEIWFGPVAQQDLDAFHAEVRKGQSIYEDAGGYMLRCYRALVALSVEEPVSYDQFIAAS